MQPRFLSEPLRLAGGPILRLQSDERLVRLVRAGSHPAFAELVHRYRPALVRYTGRLVGVERAEDVVQQGLASAHTTLMSDERPIDVKPWLYRIVHNAALNLLRSDRDLVALDDHEGELTVDGVDVQAAGRERFRSTLRAVQALPTAQRDALLLRELEGRSHEEIAAALGVTAGAARQHLMRARATMRSLATAITPYPLILKLAAMGTTAGASALPTAEVVAGAGLGLGLSKLGAGVLAAGALAGGAGIVVPASDSTPRADRTQRFAADRPPTEPSGLAAARTSRTAVLSVGTRVAGAAPRAGAATAAAAGRGAASPVAGRRRGADDERRGPDREVDGRRRGDRSSQDIPDPAGRDDDERDNARGVSRDGDGTSGRVPRDRDEDGASRGKESDDDVTVTATGVGSGPEPEPEPDASGSYPDAEPDAGSNSGPGSTSELTRGPGSRGGGTGTAPIERADPPEDVSDQSGADDPLRVEPSAADAG